jgi:hypothetical protein
MAIVTELPGSPCRLRRCRSDVGVGAGITYNVQGGLLCRSCGTAQAGSGSDEV